MNLYQRQKQLQKLILSPVLQKSLYFLQLPTLELFSAIEAEVEQNPLLEWLSDGAFSVDFRQLHHEKKESYDPRLILENTLSSPPSLFEHLNSQATLHFSGEERSYAELIIGNLDESGFLTTSLEEIALFSNLSLEKMVTVLAEIQTFDPPGIGAKDVQESLLIQLKLLKKSDTLAFRLISNHFEEMVQHRFKAIGKALGISEKTLKTILKLDIHPLNFHPGRKFSQSETPSYITCDVTISSDLTVEVNDEKALSLKFNADYLALMEDKTISKETKDYLKERILAGKGLVKTLFARHDTLHKITEEVVKKQRAFFQSPQGKLIEFTMKEVAQKLELHESTVVRAVQGKWVSSPKGMYPLRFFFSHGLATAQGENIAPHSIKEKIQALIEKEEKKEPLSDEKITHLLKQAGFKCARRTVAKYRAALGIKSAFERHSQFLDLSK